MRGRMLRWRWACIVGGVLLAVASLATSITWSQIFDSVLSRQLALTPNSRSFRQWVSPELPVDFNIYMFNWTNPDKFPDEKPHFEEIGPYRYFERRSHVNITWNPNNGTVGYRTLHSWVWDPTSKGSLNDKITTLNVIAASAIYRARFWNFLEQKGVSMALAMFGEGVSISKTAGELLFEGYEDPLIDIAKSLPPSTTGGAPPVDKFGWFYARNNTETDGYMEVTTGVDDGMPGQILQWNYKKHLPYYEGQCAQVSGSLGEFLPRNLTEDSQLKVFMPDMCRTVKFDYAESGVKDSLQFHKYEITERSFDNSSVSAENSCFCNGECAWAGVMNISACRFGVPAFMTLPHFLHGDPVLREYVSGMNPDPEKHSFYFAVEPKLGVPVDVSGRFQFNIYVEPNEQMALYEKMPRMLFPIFWVEQRGVLSESTKSELRFVRAVFDWGAVVCACSSVVFALLVVIAICCTRKPEYDKPHDLINCEKPRDEAEIKLNPK